MTPFEIPLTPNPQTFTIALNGADYRMTFLWCKAAQCWILSMDDSDGAPLLHGVPLLTGTSLLDQFEYLGIGGALVVQTDSDVDAVPGFAELGETGRLYFITP